jgi:spore germination cell wall hydrolase CwlJ-like protein
MKLIFVFIMCLTASAEASINTIRLDLLRYSYHQAHKEETILKKIKNITEEDRHWLALNIYFEARSENLHGKMAVAFVTMNRVIKNKNHWPDTIKEVVTQPWQFSWYNSKKVPPITEQSAWEDAKHIADLSIELYNTMAESEEFEVDGITKGSDHYFADYIAMPSWAKKMKFNAKVGTHIFYTDI